jgi:DNA-binding CsgD family transcriptional regulator/PAS domain-containing protein
MDSDVSDTIGIIYDAVLKPECWQDALARVCRALDAKAASVNVIDPIEGRASMFVEYGTDPTWTALLLSKYAAMSPIGAAVLMADLDQPVGAFDFVDEKEYVESRFDTEWCAPQGYYDLLGAVIAKRPREVGSISATRTLHKGKFGEAERRFVAVIAPHVRRAVTISGLLERRGLENGALVSIIDQLAVAVVIVDRNGKVHRANPAGDAMCADGAIIMVRGGKLTFASPEANQGLQSAISDNASSPQLFPARNGPDHRYIAAVLLAEPKSGLFAVLINQQEPEMPAFGKHLAQLFGLTPREVSVLLLLLENKTIDEAAAALGISEDTGRTHLKRILTKTGSTRQAELIQTVLKAVPPLRLS